MIPSERYDIRDRNVCRLSHEQRGWMYERHRRIKLPRQRSPYAAADMWGMIEVWHRGVATLVLRKD